VTDPATPSFARLAARIGHLGRFNPRYAESATSLLGQVEAVDQAVYTAIARTPTPSLDQPLRGLSRAADRSVLWVGVATALAVLGGRRGRRAAVDGLVSLGVTSFVANLVIKPVAVRARPERDEPTDLGPNPRHVRMPTSRSFPSGHSASAFAFAAGVTRQLPVVAPALYGLAALVGYSRVHTGVHFPLDVVSGATLGAVNGELVGAGVDLVRRRRSQGRRRQQGQ
jgi:membrane-associated phospholipid phosphatase